MNDQESRFAHQVTARLDAGAAALRPGAAYRLKQARAAALAALEPAPVREVEPAFVRAGGRASTRSGGRGIPAAGWLGVALLVAGLGFGYQQWHAVQQVREFEDIDLHLLASDLPIDAYLDGGFQNWLRTTFEY
ncbi:MAG: DUF3619 family protein [Betaproteobacteria bacterium]